MNRCKKCLHPEKDHRPPKTWFYIKTQASSGGFAKLCMILAPTCCWSNPLCSCTEFIPGGIEDEFRRQATVLLGGGLEIQPKRGTEFTEVSISKRERPAMRPTKKSQRENRGKSPSKRTGDSTMGLKYE
jgi:hypothetical protein